MATSWAVGITTVEQRKHTLLPRTLESLCRAGFDRPRLFVDNCRDLIGYQSEFGLPVSVRAIDDGMPHALRCAGNWHLSFLELFIRDPNADRYAMFQDDFVACLGLREYLERSPYPAGSYLNLFTHAPPRQVEPKDPKNFKGWYLAKRRERDGGPTGQGAVALVFDQNAAIKLLSSRMFTMRHQCPLRGHHSIDGGITEALDADGVKEWVHWPSLTQHLGDESTRPERKGRPYPPAPSFPGEEWDARILLG